MHERQVVVGGATLHVYEWDGAGGPLVCLPGQTAGGLTFNGFAAALAPEWRVAALDPRGRGQSEKPPHGYGYQLQVADALAVLDAFGSERAVLVGHSFGAIIALLLAAWHPRRVERLVLIDGGTEIPRDIHAAVAALAQRLDTVFPSADVYVDLLRQAPAFQPWSAEMEAYVRGSVEEVPGGVRARTARWAIEQEIRAYRDGPPDFDRLHRAVQCPTLVLRATRGFVGEDDWVLRPDAYRAMLDRIPDARGVEVDASHYTILLGRPEATIRAVRSFLEE